MSPSRRPAGRRTPRINRPSVLALEGRTLLAASPRLDSFAVPSLPNQIVDGPGGDLWSNEGFGAGGNPIAQIGRITPQGQDTEIPLKAPSGSPTPTPSAITAGPDGNLWAIDTNNNAIDRIGQDGQVATFAIPSNQRGGNSGSIVAGADGNLWFTTGPFNGGWDITQEIPNGNVPGTIDRITPEGVITPFALPLGGGVATALAAGPDGIWFLDPLAGRVGEIDSSGHAAEYPEPAAYYDLTPSSLVVGPDGDAYYYAQGSSSSLVGLPPLVPYVARASTSFLVKVAPGGAMTPIAIPGNIQSVVNMVSGPDGIDFLVQSSDQSSDGPSQALDRLNLDGTVSTLSTISADGAASGLAFGPDGNLWITEPGLAVIARLDLSPTPEPVPGPTLLGGPYPNSTLIAPIGQATTLGLANVTTSAGVTVDSATINWGDGSTPTAGTFVIDPPGPVATLFGGGTVSGSHAYAKVGPYTVTVTIDATGPSGKAMTTSVVGTATAVDPAPTTQPPLVLQASQSIADQGPLAIFSTPTMQDPSNFTATVDWGDGSKPTSGTVGGGYEQDGTAGTPPTYVAETSGPDNFFEVSGDHTYAKAGTFPVKVTLTDQLGHSSTESTSIQVEPGSLVLSPASPVLATADPTPASFGPVLNNIDLGTLTDFLGNLGGQTDSVTVDWGDGSTPTAVSLSPSGPVEYPPQPGPVVDDIYGPHAYAKAGTYTVKIFAQNNQGDLIEAPATVQVSAGKLALSPSGGSIGGTAGRPISNQPLAMIAAPNAADPASDFTATVDWGDGSTPTAGTVATVASTTVTTFTGGGSQVSFGESYSDLQVSGGHAYPQPGLYRVTVTVDGPGGSTARTTTIAFVSSADGVSTSTPTTPSFTAGLAGDPTVLGSFDSTTSGTAANFKATVDWGDGSPIQPATIQPGTPNPSGSTAFKVVGGHDYAQAGSYTVTLTVIDGANVLPAVITGQATVATPIAVTITPPTLPVLVITPPPAISKPTPVASPTPILTTKPVASPTPTSTSTSTSIPRSTPIVSPSVPRVVMGPIAPAILPRPFPDFEPAIAKHPQPAPHHKVVKPAVHPVANKPAHAAPAKKHPAGSARHVKPVQ